MAGRKSRRTTKVCADCGKRKSLSEFHAKTRYEDGTPRTWQSYCKECQRIQRRVNKGHKPRKPPLSVEERNARQRARREQRIATETVEERDARRARNRADAQRRRDRAKVDPDLAQRMEAIHARQREKIANDPERKAQLAADARMRYRLRRGGVKWSVRGAAMAFRPTNPHTFTTMPVDDFLQFVTLIFPNHGPSELFKLTTVSERRWNEIFTRRTPTVELDTVDRFVTKGLGRPDLLNILIPYQESATR